MANEVNPIQLSFLHEFFHDIGQPFDGVFHLRFSRIARPGKINGYNLIGGGECRQISRPVFPGSTQPVEEEEGLPFPGLDIIYDDATDRYFFGKNGKLGRILPGLLFLPPGRRNRRE